MKENVKVELERSLRKMSNLRKRTSEIQLKISKLEEEVRKIQFSLEKEMKWYFEYGRSSEKPQVGKPEWNSERLRKSEQYNSKLREEKKELLKTYFGEELLDENVEENLPKEAQGF